MGSLTVGTFAWGLKGDMEGLSLTELHCLNTRFRQAGGGYEAVIKDQFRCVLASKSIICLGARFVSIGEGGIAAKRKKAGWNNGYLLEVFSGF